MSEKAIFVFGDSLSDPGNSFTATEGAIPPFPYYFNGRFSNGKVAVEDLAEQLGSDYVLDPANNFAFGGASTGQRNSNEDDVGADLPGLRDQIDAFAAAIGSGEADSKGLYLVWAGPNDFLDTIGGVTFDDPAVLLQDGTRNLVYAATTLAGLGAEDIVLPNMLDLGLLPATQPHKTEATALTKAFNASVALVLGNLDIAITQVDLFGLSKELAVDPAAFGFSNGTVPLLNYKLSQGENPFADPDAFFANPDGFFFWDQFHPTTEGHEVLGNEIYQTLTGAIAQPSFNSIEGTRKADLLLGTSDNDAMDGLAGNDVISGLDGDDQLEGWRGNDQLFGNEGEDILSGGKNADTLWGGQGQDIAFGGGDRDLLFGQSDDDILVGDQGNDVANGGSGDDYILGGQGQDLVWGDGSEDILNGGSGNDKSTVARVMISWTEEQTTII